MNFDESVSYLLSLGHETSAIKLGLENVRRLLARLDNPHCAYASVQIAGTNGKGSTAAMLASVCRAARVRAGLYTSPHLASIEERVRIDGREIAREEFARHATTVREASERIHAETGARPTFFEQVTAIALCAFRDAGVRLAILETGLGGRLDATTAAEASIVGITPVALDHQEYLGDTLALIASEKAAIIRTGVRAVVAPQDADALEVILRRCRETNVEPKFSTEDVSVEGACGAGRLRATFRTGRETYAGVCLALRGRHQLTNASVAVALAEDLADAGFEIEREHVVSGLETAEHAGRLELIESGGRQLLLDGAHNPAGASALRAYLDEFVGRKVTLVFGAMRDKATGEISAILFPAAEQLVLTEPQRPRAATVRELLRVVPVKDPPRSIALAPKVSDALTIALAQTPPGSTICVTGSLYLVGEVKAILAANTEAS